ncbi:MAG: arginine--tRNA ligase [Promethearchaeota archaeon]
MDFTEIIIQKLKLYIPIERKFIKSPPKPKKKGDSDEFIDFGDLAVPCFPFAKQLKKNPKQIADDIVKNLEPDEYFSKIESMNGYINFYINPNFYYLNALPEIFDLGEKFGTSNIGNSKNIVIDYSSPNIAKPFGVAHLRSTLLGNSLKKIFKFLGYNVIGINHLGDWGTQFGKLLYAYKTWGNEKELQKRGIDYLVEIYIEFGNKEKSNPSLTEQGRIWFKKLEDGDEEARKLWKKFYDISINEFNKYYEELGIEFDYYHGESFYNDKIDEAIKFIKKNVKTEISDGALIVDLKSKGIKTPLILRKSDGASTYHARDIAAAIYRIKHFNPYKILYVVGQPQKLHFKQLFITLQLAGFNKEIFEHVEFGTMTFEGKMMSTRKGNFVLLRDYIQKAKQKILEIINQKNPNLDMNEKKEIARIVGIGAIIFSDISNDRIRDIDFTWEKALNFEGDSAPYLQYVYARINSMLNKINFNKNQVDTSSFSLLTNIEEFYLIKLLYKFPDVVKEAANVYKPSIIANYLLEIAALYNKNYNKYTVSKAAPKLKQARAALAYCTKSIIKTGLSLLGIECPNRM